MHRPYLVRTDKPTLPRGEEHAAKVIDLRARREARRQALLRAQRRHRPDAA